MSLESWHPHVETLVVYNDGVWAVTHWRHVRGDDPGKSHNAYRLIHMFGPRNGVPSPIVLQFDQFDMDVSEMEIIAIAASG